MRPQAFAKITNHIEYTPDISPHETAWKMMSWALYSVHFPNVVNFARYFIREVYDENDNLPYSKLSEIAAIHSLARKSLRYTPDPIGVEAVYAPHTVVELVEMYGRWAEDCDSISLLTLTMLLALGHQVRMCIAGFSPGMVTYSHVFAEVFIEGLGWFAVDPSLGDQVHQMCKDIVNIEYLYPEQVMFAQQNRMY